MGRLFQGPDRAGFVDVWNGPAYREFRRRVRANEPGIAMCRGCTQRNNNNRDQIEGS